MKFVVEALGLKVGGGKQLALSLMTRLANNPRHEFAFLVPDLAAYASLASARSRCITCHSRFGLIGRNHMLNRAVRRICLREHADALLCLGNFPPSVVPCPTVVLLQNSWIVSEDPVAERRQTWREKLIVRYGRHLYRHLPSQSHVIVQTTVMRDHLCQKFPIDPRSVCVIPNSISSSVGATRPSHSSGADDPARPFTFLCLARYYAHKNIEILLQAMQHLPGYTRRPAVCLLTISADQHPGAAQLLWQLSARRLGKSVVNLGPVPADQLADTYRRADALVLPTLLESHSRTYLEAMKFSLPIATSDRDFARHACRDAALYFDPLDARAVARSMAQIMEDTALRSRLVKSGRKVLAQAPSWEELAERFTATLERAARCKWTALPQSVNTENRKPLQAV